MDYLGLIIKIGFSDNSTEDNGPFRFDEERPKYLSSLLSSVYLMRDLIDEQIKEYNKPANSKSSKSGTIVKKIINRREFHKLYYVVCVKYNDKKNMDSIPQKYNFNKEDSDND